MKKNTLFVLVIIIACLVILFPQSVHANLLAECHFCNKTGKCHQCHGAKTITCDGCNGSGKVTCDGCNGTGYITCHICNGTLIADNGPCTACENCGKEHCNACTNGIMNCNGCNGSGKMNCTGCNGSDGVCTQCHGTGYLDGQSNGTTNIPKNGDTVQKLDGSYITWGSSKKATSTKTTTVSTSTSSKNATKETVTTKTTAPKDTAPTVEVPTKQPEDEDLHTITTGINPIGHVNVAPDMTGESLDTYNKMSESEKESTMETVNKIVSTATTTNISAEKNEVINTVLQKNNIASSETAKVCPISFDGHIDIGFPVNVSVDIDSDKYDVTDKIFVYHILEDNTVEALGEAKKTVEDGKVIAIEFQTTGFSDFFSTTTELKTLTNTESTVCPKAIKCAPHPTISIYLLSYVAIMTLIAIVEFIVIINLKKKRKSI